MIQSNRQQQSLQIITMGMYLIIYYCKCSQKFSLYVIISHCMLQQQEVERRYDHIHSTIILQVAGTYVAIIYNCKCCEYFILLATLNYLILLIFQQKESIPLIAYDCWIVVPRTFKLFDYSSCSVISHEQLVTDSLWGKPIDMQADNKNFKKPGSCQTADSREFK